MALIAARASKRISVRVGGLLTGMELGIELSQALRFRSTEQTPSQQAACGIVQL